jgi:hypothetical protein
MSLAHVGSILTVMELKKGQWDGPIRMAYGAGVLQHHVVLSCRYTPRLGLQTDSKHNANINEEYEWLLCMGLIPQRVSFLAFSVSKGY